MPGYKHPCPFCSTFIDSGVAACPTCGVIEPFTERPLPRLSGGPPARVGRLPVVREEPGRDRRHRTCLGDEPRRDPHGTDGDSGARRGTDRRARTRTDGRRPMRRLRGRPPGRARFCTECGTVVA